MFYFSSPYCSERQSSGTEFYVTDQQRHLHANQQQLSQSSYDNIAKKIRTLSYLSSTFIPISEFYTD